MCDYSGVGAEDRGDAAFLGNFGKNLGQFGQNLGKFEKLGKIWVNW